MHIYPNEILISALSRKVQNDGDNRKKPYNRYFFGTGHKKASIDLPSSIGALIENGIMRGTPQEIIKKHTLFPFFQPFLNKGQASKVFESMIGHGGNAVHLTSGVMASVVRSYPYLKLCPKCIVDDIEVNGEPYWHVDHQITGMTVCVKHQCTLFTHCQVCNAELAGVCPTICRNGHDLISQVHYSGSFKLGKISEGLSKTYHLCISDQLQAGDFQQLYQSRLKELGYCSERGRVNQAEIFKRFIQLFPEKMLIGIGVPLPSGVDSWLASMLRKQRRSFHPLLHVLVTLCLWGEIELFYETYQTSKCLVTCTSESGINSKLRKISVSVPRKDWNKRDKQIAAEINQALLELRSQKDKPIRISVSRVGKHIRKLGLLEKHLEKLPLCRSLLDRNLESMEQYQKNKIDWAISIIMKEDQEVIRWRVLRRASIRVLATKGVDEYIDQKINEVIALRLVA